MTGPVPDRGGTGDAPDAVVDAHVHFLEPAARPYPWLADVPDLRRAWLPEHHAAANRGVPVEALVAVEANPAPDAAVDEATWLDGLAATEPRIAAIVAFVDLTDPMASAAAFDRLGELPRVRGVRHNIQGNPPGFALETTFVSGVREAGRRGYRFDLCATHDQLGEVVELVRRCPDTAFVLDHCGKPSVRTAELEPWREHLRALAGHDNVWCKWSGLLTEADPRGWRYEDLVPYADEIVEAFGTHRLMYASDWPVLTLARRHAEWYAVALRLTQAWSGPERRRFFRDNARAFYGL